MRTATLIVVAMLLGACATPAPDPKENTDPVATEQPSTPATTGGTPTVAAKQPSGPALTWKAVAEKLSPFPPVYSGSFWWPDDPEDLGPLALGTIPSEHLIYLWRPRLSQTELAVDLPPTPAELPVYLLGDYPKSKWEEPLSLPHLDCQAGVYVLVSCTSTNNPIDDETPITAAHEAEARARAIIQQIWMDDYRLQSVTPFPSGKWSIHYDQYINGYPIYMDKPLTVDVDSRGRALYVLVRRRPVIARSNYPVRSPKEAWRLLTEGKAFGTTLVQGATNTTLTMPQFKAVEIEIAYVVTHYHEAIEVMQPYYIFRSAEGDPLLIPAVADPYVTWPWQP